MRNSSPWIGTLAFVVIFHRPPNGSISLQSQSQCGVDGAAEDEVVEWVEKVAESVFMSLVEVRVFANAF